MKVGLLFILRYYVRFSYKPILVRQREWSVFCYRLSEGLQFFAYASVIICHPFAAVRSVSVAHQPVNAHNWHNFHNPLTNSLALGLLRPSVAADVCKRKATVRRRRRAMWRRWFVNDCFIAAWYASLDQTHSTSSRVSSQTMSSSLRTSMTCTPCMRWCWTFRYVLNTCPCYSIACFIEIKGFITSVFATVIGGLNYFSREEYCMTSSYTSCPPMSRHCWSSATMMLQTTCWKPCRGTSCGRR